MLLIEVYVVKKQLFAFLYDLASEARSFCQFCQLRRLDHHRGDINPSCFNDFYSEMMSYYKSKTDKWKEIIEILE